MLIFNRLLRPLATIAQRSFLLDDDEETRTRKLIQVVAGFFVAPTLFTVGFIYLLFAEYAAGLLYVGFSSYFSINLGLLLWGHRNSRIFALAVGVVVLPSHLLVSLSLGNFINSGAIILWGLAYPVVVGLLFFTFRQVFFFFVAFMGNVVLSILLQPYLRQSINLPPVLNSFIFIVNILGVSLLILGTLAYFIYQRDMAYRLLHGEQVKAENLLLNILPAEIANILKDEHRVIAEHFDGASILFADVVGFTPMSAQMTPVELVNLLNEVFSYFDGLIEKYHLEKIKTIGDCYMAASGVPRSRPDHAHALVKMALEMQAYVAAHDFQGRRLNFRIGINSGAVVAGVIGRKKFIYDLWGDAVNTASRMESHGAGGVIQVTEATYDLIQNVFICESRGIVHIKGKGDMPVWQVLREK